MAGDGAFEAALLAILIFAVAALYSSVGQAGASGYLAAMLVVGLPAAMMRPAALLRALPLRLPATCTARPFPADSCRQR